MDSSVVMSRWLDGLFMDMVRTGSINRDGCVAVTVVHGFNPFKTAKGKTMSRTK